MGPCVLQFPSFKLLKFQKLGRLITRNLNPFQTHPAVGKEGVFLFSFTYPMNSWLVSSVEVFWADLMTCLPHRWKCWEKLPPDWLQKLLGLFEDQFMGPTFKSVNLMKSLSICFSRPLNLKIYFYLLLYYNLKKLRVVCHWCHFWYPNVNWREF